MSDFLKQFAGENYQAQELAPADRSFEDSVGAEAQQQDDGLPVIEQAEHVQQTAHASQGEQLEQTAAVLPVVQAEQDYQGEDVPSQDEQLEQGDEQLEQLDSNLQDFEPMTSIYESFDPLHDNDNSQELTQELPELPYQPVESTYDESAELAPENTPESVYDDEPEYDEPGHDGLTEPMPQLSVLADTPLAAESYYQPPAEPVYAPTELMQTAAQPPATTPQKIATAAHDVRKDTSYDKKKIARYATIAASVLALCLLIFGIFFITQQVQLRDFVGANITEARTWGIQNRITIEATEVYNLEYDTGIIISQNREADTRIRRGSVLRLEVSKGPNMNEILELPNFEEMTTQEVRQWREELRALNANINEEYSDEVEAGRFIRFEFTDPTVTESSYTRADGLLIYMSRGAQVFEANITVPNFFEKPVEEVKEWAREQRVELIIEEEAHEKVAEGHVIAQSVDPAERVAQRDEITITVSLGISVIVPNFANISFEEASYPGLEVEVQRRYNTRLAFGRLISQSVPAGTELIGEGHTITVVYSLGRPYIDNLIGESESMLAEYFYSFSAGGANITYQITYVSSYEPRGTIVGMSRYAQFLGLSERINIRVSRGDMNPPVVPEGEVEHFE